ncbi:hypothetical protein L195_g025168, partial [Trifolium pratense]
EGGNLGLQIQDQHSLVIQVHADLEESNTAAENAHLIDIQPQEVIYSESPPIMNSNAFQENAHLIVPQETMNSENVPIMNFVTSQENTHLSMPQEAIHSESAPIMNAAQENEEVTQMYKRLLFNQSLVGPVVIGVGLAREDHASSDREGAGTT